MQEMASAGCTSQPQLLSSASQLQANNTGATQPHSSGTTASKSEVTVKNVHSIFEYLQEYQVLVCKEHGYAVRSLDEHLKRLHHTSKRSRKEIAIHYTDCPIVEPGKALLPPPLEPPFDCLGPPRRAYICNEEECNELSINRDVIRIHCNKVHKWRSTPAQRMYWHEAWVQTFFNAAGLQRYFTVSYNGLSSPQKKGGRVVVMEPLDEQFGSILNEWDQDLKKQKRALEIADKEVAKTDHTLWFKRNEWPEHLAGCNLRHLSRISRLPDKEERVLQRAVELSVALIERCVAGLRSLDQETRRWLRSAKLSEIDQRPLARLQNAESQQTYSRYYSRLLCYSLRVLESTGEEEEQEGESESSDSSDDSDSDEDAQHGLEASTDIFQDARRLYPWQGRQKELLIIFRQSFDRGWDDEAQTKALLDWYESLIFQKVRGDTFKSGILHFLAVLGIDEENYRLRQANDFSYMLAGVVYCTRVLGVEVILPVGKREQQDDEDDKRFRQTRDEYLADGTYSVMSKMLSLLAYGKSIAMSHNNAGRINWSLDNTVMNYYDKPINMKRFGKMVQDIVTAAEDQLWTDLIWTRRDDRFNIPLEKLADDVTFTKRGISFITHRNNGLADKRQWMLEQAFAHKEGKKLRVGESWAKAAVKRYLRQVDRFRELLLFCVHVTGGQPARGSEITTARFRNGYMQDRNVFVIQGHIAIVTRYHKSQSQFDKPKVIPRFLPWRVGQLLAIYLAYVQPLQEYLGEKVCGHGYADYVWSNEFGAWGTDRLTKVIARETEKAMGWRLTTLDYRHVAISIGRKKVGVRFVDGYVEQSDEVEEPEMDEDDGLEISAGRRGEMGANRYGVSLDLIKHLSSRSIDTFRPLSMQWHSFLGLESLWQSTAVGEKRTAHERSSSSSASTEVEQERRKQALMLFNNGVHGWMEMLKHFPLEPVRNSSVPGGSETSDHPTTPYLSMPPPLTPAVPQSGFTTVREPQGLESSPLWHRSTIATPPTPTSPPADEEDIKRAIRKALRREDVSFRSDMQREALETIVRKQDFIPLVVVLPTGGGKSLLFTAPACLDDPGVTVVVVPYRALLDRLLQTAQEAGIDCFEWKRGEVNPAALVFVSADVVQPFMSYARVMDGKGLLRRVFIDESHLTFTQSNWRTKLTTVRLVRGLRAPTIMLTATLPVTLEFELEQHMAAQMSRYIRMRTTRPRTRYTVDMCKAGTGAKRILEVCRRMTIHLGRQKGVVYSRSRQGCETLAAELKCAYYHAGTVDNQERLERWLEKGGLMVATSALGTGVDFPDIVFILHTDVPYGMIDFAQESGRGGRAGEDVDSLIIVEEGRVEALAELSRGNIGIDQHVMDEFITTRECRRLIMSRYLDGEEIHCESEGGMARCDRCGGGLTELERQYAKQAQARQAFEELLDNIAACCPACWFESVMSGNDPNEIREHARAECRPQGNAGVESGTLRGIRFALDSHSCFRCGLSQKLCRTGQDETAECQWPGVMAGFAEVMWHSERWETAFDELGWTDGFIGGDEERKKWLGWLGQRHPQRIWGEVISNGMAALIRIGTEAEASRRLHSRNLVDIGESEVAVIDKSCVEVEEDSGTGSDKVVNEARTEEEVPGERSEGEEVRVRRQTRPALNEAVGVGIQKVQRVNCVLQQWQHGCRICRAHNGGRAEQHDTKWCLQKDKDGTLLETIYQAMLEGFSADMAPACKEGGRCWISWIRCERDGKGQGECRWSQRAREVVCALLTGRPQRTVQSWLVQRGFVGGGSTAHRQWQGFAEFLEQEVAWGDVESHILGELILMFG